jgi:hypothetical protein
MKKYLLILFFVLNVSQTYSQFWQFYNDYGIVIFPSDSGYYTRIDTVTLKANQWHNLRVVSIDTSAIINVFGLTDNGDLYIGNSGTITDINSPQSVSINSRQTSILLESFYNRITLGSNQIRLPILANSDTSKVLSINSDGDLTLQTDDIGNSINLIDTVPRLAKSWSARAILNATVSIDTTVQRYFNDRGETFSGYSPLASFHLVPASCYISKIVISHVKDSSFIRFWRDTVFTVLHNIHGSDSIEVGSSLFISYYPSNLGYPPSNGGIGQQKIVIEKRIYNHYSTIPSANYSTTILSSTHCKIPLALPNDSMVNPGQRGIDIGSVLAVEIYLTEKIIGKIY